MEALVDRYEHKFLGEDIDTLLLRPGRDSFWTFVVESTEEVRSEEMYIRILRVFISRYPNHAPRQERKNARGISRIESKNLNHFFTKIRISNVVETYHVIQKSTRVSLRNSP